MMIFRPWKEEFIGEAVHLWNRVIGDRYPMREQLMKQNTLQDHNLFREGSFVAVEPIQNRIVGFITVKRWQEQLAEIQMNPSVGWLQSLIVAPEYRRLGIGSTLLELAERSLIQSGIQWIKLGSDPFHLFPGIPIEYGEVKDWFEKKGYVKRNQVHDLICHQNQATPLPHIEGVTIRLLGLEDRERLISFLHYAFPGRWEYEAITYFDRGGSGREFVVFEKEENKEIIGFCRLNDAQSPVIAPNTYWAPLFEEELGGIGPLGIVREERKKGYGLEIVKSAIHFLQQRGIHRIVIDWTELTEFYGKLGYQVWRSYDQYEKQVFT